MVNWAVGVTSVPVRRHDLLPRTLASLAAGGFGTGVRLFLDGCSPSLYPEYVARFHGYEMTPRWPVVRAFGNFILGLGELYVRNPHADRFLMAQDDCICSRNLRGYLEQAGYESNTYQNLFIHQCNLDRCPKDSRGGYIRGWFPSNQTGTGAVALVFDNRAAMTLLTAMSIAERPKSEVRGHMLIDGGVIYAMRRAGYREVCHHPSLVQHTGHKSTIGCVRWQDAPNFLGESFDLLDLIRTS
jgi:hypothetical protein